MKMHLPLINESWNEVGEGIICQFRRQSPRAGEAAVILISLSPDLQRSLSHALLHHGYDTRDYYFVHTTS